jgi:hypothetical protein
MTKKLLTPVSRSPQLIDRTMNQQRHFFLGTILIVTTAFATPYIRDFYGYNRGILAAIIGCIVLGGIGQLQALIAAYREQVDLFALH